MSSSLPQTPWLPFFHKYPSFITSQEIKDIKQYDAWPVEAFTNHTNKDEADGHAISGETMMKIEWEDVLWPNNGSQNHIYLRKRLEEEKRKGKVPWVNTELIGDQECTLVRWKASWNRLDTVIIECSREKARNKLRMYCLSKKLQYNTIKKSAIQKLSDLK